MTLRVEKRGAVGWIVFDQPGKRNAINGAMWRGIPRAMAQFDADPEVRGYQTSARLPYHTDSSDIVGLLCLRTSKSGGLSSIVSSTTIWNELVARRPDHARTLLGEFHRTRWGEIPANMKRYASNPIFAPYKGRVFASYVRSAIMKAQATMPEVLPSAVGWTGVAYSIG